MNGTIALPNFQSSVFYSIERAIKRYRQFAARQLRECVPGMTVDQALLLATLRDQPEASQADMAAALFKEPAALTRTLELLVKRGYVSRDPHPTDGRRRLLSLSEAGKQVITLLDPVIAANRRHALQGLDTDALDSLKRQLDLISTNCQTPTP